MERRNEVGEFVELGERVQKIKLERETSERPPPRAGKEDDQNSTHTHHRERDRDVKEWRRPPTSPTLSTLCFHGLNPQPPSMLEIIHFPWKLTLPPRLQTTTHFHSSQSSKFLHQCSSTHNSTTLIF